MGLSVHDEDSIWHDIKSTSEQLGNLNNDIDKKGQVLLSNFEV